MACGNRHTSFPRFGLIPNQHPYLNPEIHHNLAIARGFLLLLDVFIYILVLALELEDI